MTAIDSLAPQMVAYSKQFHTDGNVEWAPYLMFFHPKSYRSNVVNTDTCGFRFSEVQGQTYSVAHSTKGSPARLIAGNSVVFGIGASADRYTIASRLMAHDHRPNPWLNFGGRAFNSAQELILLTLHRHLLPKIEEIVLFSGFNNLCLARLPENYIQEHGAFYNCVRFFEALEDSSEGFSLAQIFTDQKKTIRSENARSLDERINFAADLTLRHLAGWKALANDMGAKLTFVLQPTSGWVRNGRSAEEERLFHELERSPRYTTVQGDVLQKRVCEYYAGLLKSGAENRGIPFVNISPLLGSAAKPDQWLFIDHAHLTDSGYDLVSKAILEATL